MARARADPHDPGTPGRVLVPVAVALYVAGVVAVVAVALARPGDAWTLTPAFVEDGSYGPYVALVVVIGFCALIAVRLHRHDHDNSLVRWFGVLAAIGGMYLLLDLGAVAAVEAGVATSAALVAYGGLASVAFGLMWACLAVILLRFPTGQRLGGWWSAFEAIALLGPALLVLVAFHPDLYGTDGIAADLPGMANPIGTESLRVLADVGFLGWALLPVATAAGAVAVLVRFVRARGAERQQLKWVALGLGVGWPGAIALTVVETQATGDLLPSVAAAIGPVFVLFVPGGFAVALFRYRLYDVDRYIRRTVTYAIVLVALVATYGVGVITAVQVLGDLVGDGGAVGVALATIAVTVMARPLTVRVRDEVDRRFNRRRAAAVTSVRAFGERLLDEVDLDTLQAELAAVTAKAVEPRTIGVWVAPDVSATRR